MKILLVEDSLVEQRQISTFLQEWGLDFQAVADGSQAWDLLQRPDAPDFVLLDWMLPGIDGIELCRRIRSLGANGTYVYVAMLTAKDRKANLQIAMEAGADDYLAKPVDASELKARILVGKRILELQQSLRFAATHDFLTRIFNREEILASLTREIARSERDDKPAVLILGDLDHFKQINDSYGHVAGDAVLREVALRLKSDLRPYDLVGRYGGEEFLLILPNCPFSVGVRRADEIRRLVAKDPVVTTFGSIPVTISMGVAVTDALRPLALEVLLQRADTALYRAKNNGRNRVDAFVVGKAATAGL